MSTVAAEKEVWTNPGRGKVYIHKESALGKMESYCINPGEKVAITPEERQLNQEMAYSREQDLFTNGTLASVKLIDTAADFAEISENPNVVSDADLLDMFNLKIADFRKRLAGIDNMKVLTRVRDLSEKESTGTSLAQSKAIDARIEEATPVDTSRQFDDHTSSKGIKPVHLS